MRTSPRALALLICSTLSACSGDHAAAIRVSADASAAPSDADGVDSGGVYSGGADSGGNDSGGADAGGPCTIAAACLGRFTIPGTSYQLPYYSTYPLEAATASVTSVVIFNQGLQRDAANDFETLVTAAATAGQLAGTLLITPHFEAAVSVDGSACSGNADNPLADDLVWTCNAWSDGEAATNAPGVTSFGALDALIENVLATFPSAKRVTVAGFSAGGQFTQRYVAVNQVDRAAAVPAFRYVVGDPSSYLYFDTRRPVDADSCTPAGCPSGFAPFADAGACPKFNDWKYGTMALYGAAASLTPTELTTAYVGRRVTYLLGMLDNAATTAADYADLDTTCAAEAEGSFRYQRGLAYYAYASGVLDAGPSSMFPIPGCAHSPSCVFQSDAGIAAVFGP